MDWRGSVESTLSRLGVREIRPYSTYDFGWEKDEGCISTIVLNRRAEALVFRIREELQPARSGA
jgi:hypothetical protein